MTLAAFLAVSAVHLFAAMSPGPAVIMAARTSMTEGLRTGAVLSIGLGIGAVFWAATALFGISLLFDAAPQLLWALKILGAAYLIWLGFGMWRHAKAPLPLQSDDTPPRTALNAFWLGLSTQLANPKPAVFFSAVFVGMVPPQTSGWVQGALLAVVFVNEVAWNTFVARLFSFEKSRATYLSLKTILDRCFGGLLSLLGLKIALT